VLLLATIDPQGLPSTLGDKERQMPKSGSDALGPSVPFGLVIAFVTIAVATLVAGVVLWWPQSGQASTANSDLGLTLIGGSLALTAGGAVGFIVMRAEQQFDSAMRRDQSRRDLRLALGTATSAEGVDLSNQDLSGQWLREKRLSGANFRGARLFEADLSRAILIRADLTGADLRKSVLAGADLSSANLQRVKFSGADLSGANLSNAQLFDADFDRSTLERPEWTLSDGTRINERFEPAKLDGATLTGAWYHDGTRWPNGFDPEAAGARKVVVHAPSRRSELGL
jgi:uncharacterized protein YjbI with pentapeptide repeats